MNNDLSYLKNLPEDLYHDLFDFGLDNGGEIISNLARNPSTPQDIYYKIYELDSSDADWRLLCGSKLYKCPIPQNIIDGILEKHPEWEGRFH